MAYNYVNAFCAHCNEWVYKGEGVWYKFPHPHTLCVNCAEMRNQKRRKKAAKKKAAQDQLQLPLE